VGGVEGGFLGIPFSVISEKLFRKTKFKKGDEL
jgi:hypothetical protein